MTTLAASLARAYELGDRSDFPVIASDIIYQGAAVGDNGSGYARPLVAGDPFLGFCETDADNSAGAAGDINVHVRARGRVVLPISALAITDRGKDVYASDDNTFTLTQGSNTRIGVVQRWVSTGYGVVEFEGQAGLQGVAEVTQTSAAPAAITASDPAALTGVAPAAATAEPIVLTWTANEPTAGVTQTIADGSVPTVAELGQYVANINAQLAKLVADDASFRTQITALVADILSVHTNFLLALDDDIAIRTSTAAAVVDITALTARLNTLLRSFGG